MDSVSKVPENKMVNYAELNFDGKIRTVFFFYTRLPKEDMKKQQITRLVDAQTTTEGVPGLGLLTDFVSEEEEKEIIKALDSRKWSKLANRQVQHYGFEFQ